MLGPILKHGLSFAKEPMLNIQMLCIFFSIACRQNAPCHPSWYFTELYNVYVSYVNDNSTFYHRFLYVLFCLCLFWPYLQFTYKNKMVCVWCDACDVHLEQFKLYTLWLGFGSIYFALCTFYVHLRSTGIGFCARQTYYQDDIKKGAQDAFNWIISLKLCVTSKRKLKWFNLSIEYGR